MRRREAPREDTHTHTHRQTYAEECFKVDYDALASRSNSIGNSCLACSGQQPVCISSLQIARHQRQRRGERESEVEATIGVKAEDGVLKKTLNGKKWYIKTRSQTVLLGDDDDNNNIGNLGQLKRKRGQSGREGKREREVTCFGSISISTLPVVMLARLLLLH